MKLLPHQRKAVEAVLMARDLDKYHKLVIQMPTGAGKTFFAAALASVLLDENEGEGRTLFVAHRSKIVREARDEFSHFFPSSTLGIVQAKHNQFSAQHVFATIQTIEKPHRLNLLLSSGKFDLIVFDECHRSVAPSWLKVFQAALADGGMLIGLTATPMRSDNQSLRKLYDEVIAPTTMVDLIVQDPPLLCDLRRMTIVVPDLDLKGTRRGEDGDFDEKEVEEAIQHSTKRYQYALDAVERYGKGPGLVFNTSVADAIRFADFCTVNGVRMVPITGETEEIEREAIWEPWVRNEIRAVTNVDVFTEGVNAHHVRWILIMRHTASQGRYVQMVGRGTRILKSDQGKPYEEWEKQYCLIMDMADNNHSCLVLPDLVGTTEEKMGTKSVREVVKQEPLLRAEPMIPLYKPGQQQLAVTSSSIFTTRDWKPMGRDGRAWKLSSDGGTVFVEQDFAGFIATWVSPDGKTKRHIQRSPAKVDHAFGAAEMFLAQQESKLAQRERAHTDTAYRAIPADSESIRRFVRARYPQAKRPEAIEGLVRKHQGMTKGEITTFWDQMKAARARGKSWHSIYLTKRKNVNDRIVE